MRDLSQFPGFPGLHGYFKKGSDEVIVMDLLGESLYQFFRRKGRKLPLQMVLTAFNQMIIRLEAMHDAGYIHRDIKP
jgi:casein kinase 1 alpha